MVTGGRRSANGDLERVGDALTLSEAPMVRSRRSRSRERHITDPIVRRGARNGGQGSSDRERGSGRTMPRSAKGSRKTGDRGRRDVGDPDLRTDTTNRNIRREATARPKSATLGRDTRGGRRSRTNDRPSSRPDRDRRAVLGRSRARRKPNGQAWRRSATRTTHRVAENAATGGQSRENHHRSRCRRDGHGGTRVGEHSR